MSIRGIKPREPKSRIPKPAESVAAPESAASTADKPADNPDLEEATLIEKGVIIGPWVGGALALFWGLVHFGAIYPDRTKLTCEEVGSIPAYLWCIDMDTCDPGHFMMTLSAMQQDRMFAITCSEAMSESQSRLPKVLKAKVSEEEAQRRQAELLATLQDDSAP